MTTALEGGDLADPLPGWLLEANRVYRLLRVGVTLEQLGYDDGLPALLGERIVAVDDVYRRVDLKRNARIAGWEMS